MCIPRCRSRVVLFVLLCLCCVLCGLCLVCLFEEPDVEDIDQEPVLLRLDGVRLGVLLIIVIIITMAIICMYIYIYIYIEREII